MLNDNLDRELKKMFAPRNEMDPVEATTLIGQITGAFYRGLKDEGIEEPEAHALTQSFISAIIKGEFN